MRCRRGLVSGRLGSAAVETAVVTPLLILLGLGATDLGLFCYSNIQLASAAANGAYFASKSLTAGEDTSGITNAALLDRLDTDESEGGESNDGIEPCVTSVIYDEGHGRKSVEVRITYEYRTWFSFPGLPSQMTLVQKARFPVFP